MSSKDKILAVLKSSLTDSISLVERSIRRMKEINLYANELNESITPFIPTNDSLNDAEDIAARLLEVVEVMARDPTTRVLIAANMLAMTVKSTLLEGIVNDHQDDVLAVSWLASLVASRDDEADEDDAEEEPGDVEDVGDSGFGDDPELQDEDDPDFGGSDSNYVPTEPDDPPADTDNSDADSEIVRHMVDDEDEIARMREEEIRDSQRSDFPKVASDYTKEQDRRAADDDEDAQDNRPPKRHDAESTGAPDR